MKFRNESKLLSNIKWEFRKLKVALMRKKLEQSDFFEGVSFTGDIIKEEIQKGVARWMFDLKKYKQIEIKKFKDLFSDSEVTFPIEIEWAMFTTYININIIDAYGNKYYMSNENAYDYHRISEYSIGKRNDSSEPLIDKELCYRICKDGTNELIKTIFLKLNQDGSNSDTIGEIYFDDITRITICSNYNKIKVEYPKRTEEFDEEVIKYLFECIETKWYYYDVYPILKWMVGEMKEHMSVHIVAEINGEIFSEIEIEDDIVKKYTSTQIISEEEMHTLKKVFVKELNEFLLENNSILWQKMINKNS